MDLKTFTEQIDKRAIKENICYILLATRDNKTESADFTSSLHSRPIDLIRMFMNLFSSFEKYHDDDNAEMLAKCVMAAIRLYKKETGHIPKGIDHYICSEDLDDDLDNDYYDE